MERLRTDLIAKIDATLSDGEQHEKEMREWEESFKKRVESMNIDPYFKKKHPEVIYKTFSNLYSEGQITKAEFDYLISDLL